MPIEVDATTDGAMRSLTLRLTLLRPNEESQRSHSTTEITSDASGTSQSASQMHVVKQFVFPVAQSLVGTFVQTLSLDELIRFHALGSCAGTELYSKHPHTPGPGPQRHFNACFNSKHSRKPL